MRIAQRTVTRNYLKRLNNNRGKMAESERRIDTGMMFERLSENVSDGTRALKIQQQRIRAMQQKESVGAARDKMETAWTNMNSIDGILQTVQEKTLKAMQTDSDVKPEVLDQELGKLQEELVQFANAQYADQYLFGGVNNGMEPFKVGEDGRLTYNSVPMDDIYKDPDDGRYYADIPGNTPEKTLIARDESSYIDIGLGLRIENGIVDPTSAFEMNFSGADLLGVGKSKNADGQEITNNVYNIITDIRSHLVPDYDAEALRPLFTQLVERNNAMRLNTTDVDTKAKFLEATEARLTKEIDALETRESALISTNDGEEAMRMKTNEYVWMATLQMGATVLPTSLMDFMR